MPRKPAHPYAPVIEPVEATPERIKYVADLAIHACFEAQMGGGKGPFTIIRRGKELVCHRFLVTEGGTHVYAASYKGHKAWPLTEDEMKALAEHTGWRAWSS